MSIGVGDELIALMETAGVMFDKGLTDVEVARAEENYDIRFPPDLRAFLQTAFPKHFPFPNWRSENDPFIREMLEAPIHGILFDVERNDFWLPEWGSRPLQSDDRKSVVERIAARAPKLIPIYSHRMMPDRPFLPGNPVLSVHQTDIYHLLRF
jgi:hypothetical protein